MVNKNKYWFLVHITSVALSGLLWLSSTHLIPRPMLQVKPLFGCVLFMAEGKEQERSWKLVMGYVIWSHKHITLHTPRKWWWCVTLLQGEGSGWLWTIIQSFTAEIQARAIATNNSFSSVQQFKFGNYLCNHNEGTFQAQRRDWVRLSGGPLVEREHGKGRCFGALPDSLCEFAGFMSCRWGPFLRPSRKTFLPPARIWQV